MKVFASIGATALALALTACGGAPEDTNEQAKPAQAAAAEAPKAPKTEMGEKEIEQFKVSFEQAMEEIPPELREDFQKLFNCEIEKNNKLPADKQRNFDGDAVRQMTAALKKDRSVANCS